MRKRRTKAEIQADLEAKAEKQNEGLSVIQKQTKEYEDKSGIVDTWYEVRGTKLVQKSRNKMGSVASKFVGLTGNKKTKDFINKLKKQKADLRVA